MPMLRRVGGEVLKGTVGLIKDVASGRPAGESAKKRLVRGINTFIGEDDEPEQTGSGAGRTYKTKRKRRRSVKRNKKKRDIFG